MEMPPLSLEEARRKEDAARAHNIETTEELDAEIKTAKKVLESTQDTLKGIGVTIKSETAKKKDVEKKYQKNERTLGSVTEECESITDGQLRADMKVAKTRRDLDGLQNECTWEKCSKCCQQTLLVMTGSAVGGAGGYFTAAALTPLAWAGGVGVIAGAIVVGGGLYCCIRAQDSISSCMSSLYTKCFG